MMIGHISDTHLGAFMERSEELREVSEDVHEVFSEAIELFIREHVDVVIHSGDVLDKPRPYGDAVRVLLEGVRKLKERGIPFLFTLGEHDISPIRSTPYPVLVRLMELGEYVGDGQLHEVKGLTVVGLHKHKTFEREVLVRRLEEIGATVRSVSGKKVLVLHQGLKEAFGPGSELSLSELPRGFDYYAMGHIHKHYETRLGRGLLAYPGPAHWVSADDPDECGVLMVDLSGDEPQVQWVKLEGVRPKVRISVRSEDLERVLRGLLEAEIAKKPVLWMEVEGEGVDVRELESRLAQRFVVRKLTIRKRQKGGEELGHEEALDVEAKLRELALNAIGDEEVVEYALKGLLKLLSEGRAEDVEQSLWDFWKNRYGVDVGEVK